MHLQTDPESLVPDPVSPPSFLRRWHLLIMQHAVCFVPHVYVRSWWEALPCVRAKRGGEGVCSVLVLMRVSCHRICLGSHPLLRANNFHLHVCLCSYFHCWCTSLWEMVKMYARAAERGRNFIIVTFVTADYIAKAEWRDFCSVIERLKNGFRSIPHFVQYKAEGKH